MLKMLPILITSFFWAVITHWTTYKTYRFERHQPLGNRIAFALLVISLAMPVALRTSYNDTRNYMRNFVYGDTFMELLESGFLHLLKNPAFHIYSSIIRTFTDNYTIFFLFPAFFVHYSYARFIRRHCPNFLMGMILYFCLGTYSFSIAAMKQTIAMAILLYAVDDLIDRKTKQFYLKVFLAFLFHTYAIIFMILPLFTNKPWSFRTFAFLGMILFVMRNFESVILAFLEIANENGKEVSGSELLGTASINPIRVAVYAVTPMFALAFRKYLFSGPENREQNILVNMSIISVSIMSVGLVSAANMFARMAQYFEFGLICSLPWMLYKPFEERSRQLISLIAIACFAGYFYYANVIWMPFDENYSAITLLEFFETLYTNFIFG